MGLGIAYFVVWTLVVLYVARMAVRQRSLEQAVKRLEERLASSNRQQKTARAA